MRNHNLFHALSKYVWTILVVLSLAVSPSRVNAQSGYFFGVPIFVSTYMSIDSTLDGQYYAAAESDFADIYAYWQVDMELSPTLTMNGWQVGLGTLEGIDYLEYYGGFAATAGSHYSITGNVSFCQHHTQAPEYDVFPDTCISVASGSYSQVAPTPYIPPGSNPDQGNSPPEVDSISVTPDVDNGGMMGDFIGSSGQVSLYGENLNPDGNTSVTGYPSSMSFSPNNIGDTEIDGRYTIDCNATPQIGAFFVSTSGGWTYSPDFNIVAPYISSVSIAEYNYMSLSQPGHAFVSLQPGLSVCSNVSNVYWGTVDTNIATVTPDTYDPTQATIYGVSQGLTAVTATYVVGGTAVSGSAWVTIH
jgi:hypothetical protein